MDEVPRRQSVLTERDPNGVGLIALNRPDVRHALDNDLIEAIAANLDAFARDPTLRVLILTSTGIDAFCSGADLNERRRMTPLLRGAHSRAIEGLADAIASCPVPTIAAVNGFALAGGAELAVACDLRVAASTAIFGFPEVRIGIFPGAGGGVRLPRLIGMGSARELLLTGRRIEAGDALRIGLIEHLVSGNDALPVARALATTIAENAPLAVRALKLALRESAGLSDSKAAEIIARHRRQLDDTEDYAEGLAAFAEHRPPRFVGR
ncbi:MAG: enoyl-CoA hydratase/isomerase family protein [Thermomicrobiales bacterium]